MLKNNIKVTPLKNFLLRQWKVFKNDEKFFLFDVKSSFRSQDL